MLRLLLGVRCMQHRIPAYKAPCNTLQKARTITKCYDRWQPTQIIATGSNSWCRTFTSSHVLYKEPTHTSVEQPPTSDQEPEAKVGLFKRFRNAYKEHGKVLIGVHCVTSTVWISVFYYAAVSGVDLVPLLQKMGVADKIIQLAQSSVGNLATAYLMYKIATPARYTVTLFGTYRTVKYLKKLGYIEVPPQGDSIRELMKDSRVQMKERYGDLKVEMKDKLEERQRKKRHRTN